MALGTFISQRDQDNMLKVAVLGPKVVTDLFGDGADPLGKTIKINNQLLKIIGVTVFQNQDDVVFVPLSTAQKQLFGVDYVSTLSIEAVSSECHEYRAK